MQKNGSSFVTTAVYHRIGPAGHQPQAIWRRLGGRRASLLSSILARTLTCGGRRRVRRIRRWVSSRRLTRPGAGRPQVVPYQGFGSDAWNGDRIRGGRPEWCGRAGSKRGCGPSGFGKYIRRIKAHILYNRRYQLDHRFVHQPVVTRLSSGISTGSGRSQVAADRRLRHQVMQPLFSLPSPPRRYPDRQ